jgi:DNA-directed RNA polymerase sigma subunit (sigma70/sigma32)
MVEMRSGGATLQQIGDEFNLSRERVRQILRAAG